MRAFEVAFRIHRDLAVPTFQLPKVTAKAELGAGAAECLGLGARSAIFIVSPSFTGAGPGAESLDRDGAGDDNLASGDHHVRLVDLLLALDVAYRRHREGLGPTSWAEQAVEALHVCGPVGVGDDAGFPLSSFAIAENTPGDFGSGVLVSRCVSRGHGVLPCIRIGVREKPPTQLVCWGRKRGDAIHLAVF